MESLPQDLMNNVGRNISIYSVFAGCENLKGNAIPLWNMGFSNINGFFCYAGCYNINDYDQIPEGWN